MHHSMQGKSTRSANNTESSARLKRRHVYICTVCTYRGGRREGTCDLGLSKSESGKVKVMLKITKIIYQVYILTYHHLWKNDEPAALCWRCRKACTSRRTRCSSPALGSSIRRCSLHHCHSFFRGSSNAGNINRVIVTDSYVLRCHPTMMLIVWPSRLITYKQNIPQKQKKE